MTTKRTTRIGETAAQLFASGFYCAESVVVAVARELGLDEGLAQRMATGFCSGLARTRGPCGALSGAIMAVGLIHGRSDTATSVEACYTATQRLLADFERELGSRDCHLLLGCDLGTPEGQRIFREQRLAKRCAHITRRAAELAARCSSP